MSVSDDLDALHRSDQHAVRTVDSLTDHDWTEPSLLPGWSRAHVVAHLALNAEGFTRALGGLLEGERVPIYDSDEARDAGITALGVAPYGQIRERYFAATQHFRDVAAELRAEHWAATVERTPGGASWPADTMVRSRWVEVEIHLADLGTAYTHADWPLAFAELVLDRATKTHTDSPESPDFAVHASDLGRSWQVGADTPVVTGTAADLGWWLVGRGRGEGLVADDDRLPALGPWGRAPRVRPAR